MPSLQSGKVSASCACRLGQDRVVHAHRPARHLGLVRPCIPPQRTLPMRHLTAASSVLCTAVIISSDPRVNKEHAHVRAQALASLPAVDPGTLPPGHLRTSMPASPLPSPLRCSPLFSAALRSFPLASRPNPPSLFSHLVYPPPPPSPPPHPRQPVSTYHAVVFCVSKGADLELLIPGCTEGAHPAAKASQAGLGLRGRAVVRPDAPAASGRLPRGRAAAAGEALPFSRLKR